MTAQERIAEASIRMTVAQFIGQDLGQVSETADFSEDLGMDSLDRLELMAAVEKEYDVTLSDQELSSVSNMRELIRALAAAPARFGSVSSQRSPGGASSATASLRSGRSLAPLSRGSIAPSARNPTRPAPSSCARSSSCSSMTSMRRPSPCSRYCSARPRISASIVSVLCRSITETVDQKTKPNNTRAEVQNIAV